MAKKKTDTANSQALTQNAATALATTSSQLPRGAPTNSAPRATIVFAATTRVMVPRGDQVPRGGVDGRQEEAVDQAEHHSQRAQQQRADIAPGHDDREDDHYQGPQHV